MILCCNDRCRRGCRGSVARSHGQVQRFDNLWCSNTISHRRFITNPSGFLLSVRKLQVPDDEMWSCIVKGQRSPGGSPGVQVFHVSSRHPSTLIIFCLFRLPERDIFHLIWLFQCLFIDDYQTSNIILNTFASICTIRTQSVQVLERSLSFLGRVCSSVNNKTWKDFKIINRGGDAIFFMSIYLKGSQISLLLTSQHISDTQQQPYGGITSVWRISSGHMFPYRSVRFPSSDGWRADSHTWLPNSSYAGGCPGPARWIGKTQHRSSGGEQNKPI